MRTVAGSRPRSTLARVDRLVATRHRDRDYGLRRILFLADTLALWLALELALWVVGEWRGQAEVDALWILPTIPVWFLLFRAYGLYQRPLRTFEPTHLDDLSSVFHALVIGTLGLWLWFRFMPVQQLDLKEVIAFGAFAFLLTISFRAAVRIIGLRMRGPEKVLVIDPSRPTPAYRHHQSQTDSAKRDSTDDER